MKNLETCSETFPTGFEALLGCYQHIYIVKKVAQGCRGTERSPFPLFLIYCPTPLIYSPTPLIFKHVCGNRSQEFDFAPMALILLLLNSQKNSAAFYILTFSPVIVLDGRTSPPFKCNFDEKTSILSKMTSVGTLCTTRRDILARKYVCPYVHKPI